MKQTTIIIKKTKGTYTAHIKFITAKHIQDNNFSNSIELGEYIGRMIARSAFHLQPHEHISIRATTNKDTI